MMQLVYTVVTATLQGGIRCPIAHVVLLPFVTRHVVCIQAWTAMQTNLALGWVSTCLALCSPLMWSGIQCGGLNSIFKQKVLSVLSVYHCFLDHINGQHRPSMQNPTLTPSSSAQQSNSQAMAHWTANAAAALKAQARYSPTQPQTVTIAASAKQLEQTQK